jgi:hypothetical protein
MIRILCKDLLHGHIDTSEQVIQFIRTNLRAMLNAGSITDWSEHEIPYHDYTVANRPDSGSTHGAR